MQIYYCDICGKRVTDEEIAKGRGTKVGEACFCRKCAMELRGHAPVAKSRQPTPARSTPARSTPVPRRQSTGRHQRAGTRRSTTSSATRATRYHPSVESHQGSGLSVTVFVAVVLLAVAGVGLFIFLHGSGRQNTRRVGGTERFSSERLSASGRKPPESIAQSPPDVPEQPIEKPSTDTPTEPVEPAQQPEVEDLTPASPGEYEIPPNAIVMDNKDASLSFGWESSYYSPGYFGSDYIHDKNGLKGTKTARFKPDIPSPGRYEVYLTYTEGPNRAGNTPIKISHSRGEETVTVNQKEGGGTFKLLGTFPLQQGDYVEISNRGTDGFVVADAVMFKPIEGKETVDGTETASVPLSSLREKYLDARRQFEKQLKERKYSYASQVISDLLKEPYYSEVADLLKADLRDTELLTDFVERVAQNIRRFVGQTVKIGGHTARLQQVRGLRLTLRIAGGAVINHSITSMATQDFIEFYNASPHSDPARAAACRGAFYLAEGMLNKAKWVLGQVQLNREYSTFLSQRLKLLSEEAVADDFGPPEDAVSVSVGSLVTASGTVFARRKGARALVKLEQRNEILSTDRIMTRDATALFRFTDGTSVQMNEGTEVYFESLNGTRTARLFAGEIFCEQGNAVHVITPHGEVLPPGLGSAAQTADEAGTEQPSAWRNLLEGATLDAAGWNCQITDRWGRECSLSNDSLIKRPSTRGVRVGRELAWTDCEIAFDYVFKEGGAWSFSVIQLPDHDNQFTVQPNRRLAGSHSLLFRIKGTECSVRLDGERQYDWAYVTVRPTRPFSNMVLLRFEIYSNTGLEVSNIRYRPLDGGETGGTGAGDSDAGWEPVFDGTSTSVFAMNAPGWTLRDGSLARTPGSTDAAQTVRRFDDGQLRVRFSTEGFLSAYFGVRQSSTGSYIIKMNKDRGDALTGGTNELVFTCRGPEVTATLNGQSVNVAREGSPGEGPLQFSAIGDMAITGIEYRPLPPAGSWVSIFNGVNLDGWRTRGGRSYVENGALISGRGADLYYEADWKEFVLQCELKGNVGALYWAAVCMPAMKPWRSPDNGVQVTFHGDGDIHVTFKGKRLLRTGAHKIDLSDWTEVTFTMTKDLLELRSQGEFLGAVDLSPYSLKPGGLLFFSHNENFSSYMRNAKVKVLSR